MVIPIPKCLFKIKLKSDQNYITRFAYSSFDQKNKLISADLKLNIMKNAYDAIKSYYVLKNKGHKCNRPKYISDMGLYILPFYPKNQRFLDRSLKIFDFRHIIVVEKI